MYINQPERAERDEQMANDKPQIKCPHCDYDLFESGVTERAKCATGIREVHFERTGITINYPKFEGDGD